MAIIRSKIARQLLAEGGSPRRKGFMFGSGKGSVAESMSEAAFSPDTFSGFSGDYGGFSSPAGGPGPAPDSDPDTMDDTRTVNLGLDVSRKPAFTTPDPDDDRGFFAALSNPRKALSIRYIENELDRRKNFDKTLAGKLGFNPNEKPFDDKFLSRTQELEAALNLAKRGINVTDIIQKGRPGYNPNREGDSEPMIKLRAPITEKIEEKPKDEFADILKFYGARFARGGDVDYADQDLEEQAAIDAGVSTAQMSPEDRDAQGYGGGDSDDLPTLAQLGPTVYGGGPTTNVSGFGLLGRSTPTISKATRDKMLEDFMNLDTGPTTLTSGQVPGGLLGTTGTKGTQPTSLDDLRQTAEDVGRAISDPTSPLGGALDFGKAAVAREKELAERFGIGKADGGDVRQEYGLGSIVKKATRAVKKVAKSPLGKAALIAGIGAYGLGAGPFANVAGSGFLKGPLAKKIFLKKGATDFALANINPFTAITAASLLAGGLSKEDEEDEKLPTVANTDPEMTRFLEFYGGPRRFAAEGGMMEQDEMLDLGGNEMDLRGGGFVPLGEYEKKDDVPARLSKNEFVFTADAVRAAGGGSVDKGADVMYKTMKTLENKIA